MDDDHGSAFRLDLLHEVDQEAQKRLDSSEDFRRELQTTVKGLADGMYVVCEGSGAQQNRHAEELANDTHVVGDPPSRHPQSEDSFLDDSIPVVVGETTRYVLHLDTGTQVEELRPFFEKWCLESLDIAEGQPVRWRTEQFSMQVTPSTGQQGGKHAGCTK